MLVADAKQKEEEELLQAVLKEKVARTGPEWEDVAHRASRDAIRHVGLPLESQERQAKPGW